MNKPEYGKQYALTGKTGDKCIANGNTWKESLIVKKHPTVQMETSDGKVVTIIK